MNKGRLFFLLFCISLLLAGNSKAQELPRGSSENCLYIMPLFEGIRVNGEFTYEEKRAQILKIKEQLGFGNLYHRLGISFIYGPNVDSDVRPACELAQEAGIHVGLIFALQSHTREDYRALGAKDFRLYQWRKDGNDWKGSFTSSGTIEVPEDQRDYKIPTPSRYAAPLREYNFLQAGEWAKSVKKLMSDFPGVITCINGPIEEELVVGGMNNQDKLGDYSPFAVTEYRDWLRHSGLYDASSGKYAGEGASKLIIGDLMDFNGTLRSQFYDDATPEDNNGTGVSFNAFFGTHFTTWSLRYWDLDIYPAAITDVNFDCSPESGLGFCAGGFDAPRILDANSKFWKAWSYDTPDQGGNYPTGNPVSPAYGFRQNLTRNFVRDLFDVVASIGIPREIMYAHQIPGEALGDFTGGGGRNRSSASTVWSGYLEKSQTVGITRFGDINPGLMTQYADDWGIFEWHTAPNAAPTSQALYDASINALNNYYQHKVHYLFPGWWTKGAPDIIFPLNDSRFAVAIKDFMQARDEVPYNQQGTSHNYSPPRVTGVSGFVDVNKMLIVKWNERIWQDLLQKWSDWRQFANFEIQWSVDGVNWLLSEKTSLPGFTTSVIETTYKVRVRAISKNGLFGDWSEIATLKPRAGEAPLSITPEYSSMYADPEMSNKITVSVGDSSRIIDPALLAVTISGEGREIFNTTPGNVNTIEKFWPMNSLTEIVGPYGLNVMNTADGLFQATVSDKVPVDPYFTLSGSSLNGALLPYIAFRLYSDVPSSGQLYFFLNSGFKTIDFAINKGWNVYSFSNLPGWTSENTIKSVRLDPGTTASAKIVLDWFAISSQSISANLVSSFTIKGNKATFLTSPTVNPGGYTVSVSIDNQFASTTIQTLTSNQKPVVSILLPLKDTIVEKGKKIKFMAEAKDSDGKVNYVNYLANNSLIQKSIAFPYVVEWIPGVEGNYDIIAEAYDNANESTRSTVKSIQVVDQKPFPGPIHVVPGLIEAEDYDTGGENISYHDKDALNQGGVYRTDPVDIIQKTSYSNGYCIGWTDMGEWLEYSIDVKKDMKMDMNLLVASKTAGGEIHLELNDKLLTNHLVIGNTGGDQIFKMASFKDIYLHEGIQKLKVFIDKGEMSIDYIEIAERIVTGIKDVFQSYEHLLYPNPTQDEIRINVNGNSKIIVRIVSLNGQLVRLFELSPGNEKVISVSKLSRGVYIVWVISDGKIFKEKLIKI